MAASHDISSLFERLMVLNAEAFAAGHYNTAYHLLAGALHEGDENAQRFRRVQQVAEAQLAAIDATQPEYEHSTASAASRGHTSIFALLAQQAHAKHLMAQTMDAGHTALPPHPPHEHHAP
jgi:hypothetical protein